MRDGLSSSWRWILEGFVSLSQHLIKRGILYFLDHKTRLKGNGLRVFTVFFSVHTLEVRKGHTSGCSLSLPCSRSPRSQRWKTPGLAHRCLIHPSGCRLHNGSVTDRHWGGATGSLAQGLTAKCGRASCSTGLAETGSGPWREGSAGLVGDIWAGECPGRCHWPQRLAAYTSDKPPLCLCVEENPPCWKWGPEVREGITQAGTLIQSINISN